MTNKIKIDHNDLISFVKSVKDKNYQIPTFQRDVVWDKLSIKKLWDSIYKFYPIGSILVWKTDMKLQNHKDIGGHIISDDTKESGFQYILDGQQRTTSLLTSLYGVKIANREKFNPQLYVDLTVRETGDIENETYKERFLFFDEIDDNDGKNKQNIPRKKLYEQGLIVKLLDVKENFNSLYKMVSAEKGFESNEIAQLFLIKQIFDSYELSFIELSGIEVGEVCQIFERINQAGKRLDIFDIVVAKTFAPETKSDKGFYLRKLIDDFRDNSDFKNSPFVAFSDKDYLQTLAVLIRLNDENSGVQNITDRYLNNIKREHIQTIWSDATKAICKTFDFFENYLHLQPYLIPFGYFYFVITAYFFKNENPDYNFLSKFFWYTSFYDDDKLSNSKQIKESISFLKEHKEFSPFKLNKEKLRFAKYSSQGRMSRAILALYANKEPRDWNDKTRKVIVNNFFRTTDKPNLHHIFPTNSEYVHKHSSLDQNSLMNIAFITQSTNLDISNKEPIEYLKEYFNDNSSDVMSEHFIPEETLYWIKNDELPNNALSVFIEKRIELIEADLREKLKGIDFQIIDTKTE